MKKVFVEALRAGDKIDDTFVLAEKILSQKRNGENYLNITLADRTGRIKGVAWDNVDRIVNQVASGDFVRVIGNISEYREALQFVVKEMTPCLPDTVNPSDYLPAAARDVDQMFSRLTEVTDSMENRHLKRLFELFWNDAGFTRDFKAAPAAKKMHHAYLGGLLEHTLSMALLADRIAGHYGGIDRDLLIAGAILHDIGKIREFEYSTNLNYSDEGRLVSHIIIGVQILEEKIQNLEDFPVEMANLLKHMIISHHGAREFGSPEPPKTIEAVLLYYIDEIDSKVNGIREFMAVEESGENWTAYHRLLGRHFYKGKIMV